MEVKFFLKDKGRESSSVRAIIRYKGQRYQISVGETVITKYWNTKLYRCRTVRDYPEASHINIRLDDWDSLIKNAIASFGLITPTLLMLKDAINKSIVKLNIEAGGIINDEDSQLFVPFVSKFINETIRADSTKKSYITCLNKLIEYEDRFKVKLRFIDIDISFYNKFKSWMLTSSYVRRTTVDKDGKINEERYSYTKNYIGGLFKHIITFMNSARKMGLHEFAAYQNDDFVSEREETDSIYLTQNEIQKIYNLNFSDRFLIDNGYDGRQQSLSRAKKSLNEERDRFLIGCFTALRHSDYSRLDALQFKDDIIGIWTKKKDKKVYIPMHWMLKEILRRRNNILPYPISDQKHNDQIKIIGKLAGIDHNILLTKTRGGVRQNITGKKYEFITSHTARRSGATNMYLAGVDLKFIQDILGHSKIEQTIKYIKVSAEDNAKRLIDHPYFSGKPDVK